MADDCPNYFITQFLGTASKEYCYKTEKSKTEITAKGIGKKTKKKFSVLRIIIMPFLTIKQKRKFSKDGLEVLD